MKERSKIREQLFKTPAVLFLYVEVSIPAQGFLKSEWPRKRTMVKAKVRLMLAKISHTANGQSHIYITL